VKKIGVLILFLLSIGFFSVASATSLYDHVNEAQLYGIHNINLSNEAFLAPWRSNEEQADQFGPIPNQAYCYTPFLVVAADARSKMLNNAPVLLQDGTKIWQDYAGFLTFMIQLYLTEPIIPKDLSVWIEQKNSRFFVYQVQLQTETKPVIIVKDKSFYLFSGYYYFVDDDIRYDSPLVLVVAFKDKQVRFHFNMKLIR
jgi:hypothetical protein